MNKRFSYLANPSIVAWQPRACLPAICCLLVSLTAMACSTADHVGAEDYLTGVSLVGGATATAHPGAPPAPSGTLPLTVPSTTMAINGGSTTVTIQTGASIATVYVAIAEVDGYWQITVPPSSALLRLLLTLAQTLPAQDFPIVFQVEDTAGNISQPQSMQTTVVQVGTGDIQVSVSWDALNDVDLHVVEPSGFEVFYGDKSSPDGGKLDLDSNPGCAIDGVNNENIRWLSGTAPHGTYTVRVDNYDNCTGTAANYVVTVQKANQAPQTFTGMFAATDRGDGGSSGAGVTVTTFTFP